MELAGDAVTLVIKAPNQQIQDQTVDCMLGWTVKKLKEHLKTVYPNKPSEKHQKLIYSGKLLADHLTLKEVLRQFDDGSNKHTVHLVCSSPYIPQQNTYKEKESKLRVPTTQSSVNPEPSQSSTGVRYRGGNATNNQGTHPQPFVNPNQPVFNNLQYGGQYVQMPQIPAGFPPEAVAAMYGGMPQGAGMSYTPEQYMWMQQMYAQYMAQYMQYYQQAGYPVQTNFQTTVPTNEPNIENRNVENNQQDVQAGGEMDDDEEFRQRDWLDYLYYFSRLMVLLGIVYFYSNLTRFVMVAVFFVLVYFYQMGLLVIQPRRRQQQQQQQQQQQANPQPQQPEQEPQQPNTEQTDQTENTDNSGDTQTPPPQPQGPGVLKLTWTFVSTFFTSLFPAPPPPVNIN